MIATVVERLKKAAAQPKDLEAEALIRQETATLASCKYEFDPHARRAKGVTRPQARRSGSKPVKRQRRLHSESQRV